MSIHDANKASKMKFLKEHFISIFSILYIIVDLFLIYKYPLITNYLNCFSIGLIIGYIAGTTDAILIAGKSIAENFERLSCNLKSKPNER